MTYFNPLDVVEWQDRIHRIVFGARLIRFGTIGIAFIEEASRHLYGAITAIHHGELPNTHQSWVFWTGLSLFVSLFTGAFFGLAIGMPAAILYRRRRSSELRLQLVMLPREDQKQVLFPLCNSGGEMGKVVDAIVEELGLNRD